METLFQVILVLTVLKYTCKAGFFNHWIGAVVFALFAAVIAIVFYPYVIQLESNAFEKTLANKAHVSNIVLIITIEAISGMMISIGMLNNLFAEKKKKYLKVLKLTPGVVIIGVVFYIELSVFKQYAGHDFLTLAVATALLILGGMYFLSWGIRRLFVEISTRYELKFVLNVLLFIFAILLNAGLVDYNRSNYQGNPEYFKMVVFLGICLLGLFLGYLKYKYGINFLKRK